MLKKVISGGQIGADIAGLRAAKAVGLETGGFLPKGFKTKDGSKPEYIEQFGMTEHWSTLYPYRTQDNVKESDATFRFAHNFNSPGERCTLRNINKYKQVHLDFPLIRTPSGWGIESKPVSVAKWLETFKVETLNIAGNADHTIEFYVDSFLRQVFREAFKLQSEKMT